MDGVAAFVNHPNNTLFVQLKLDVCSVCHDTFQSKTPMSVLRAEENIAQGTVIALCKAVTSEAFSVGINATENVPHMARMMCMARTMRSDTVFQEHKANVRGFLPVTNKVLTSDYAKGVAASMIFNNEHLQDANVLDAITTTFPVYMCDKLGDLISPRKMSTFRDIQNVLRSGGLGIEYGSNMMCNSAVFPIMIGMILFNDQHVIKEGDLESFMVPNCAIVPFVTDDVENGVPMMAIVALNDIVVGEKLSAQQNPLMDVLSLLDICVSRRQEMVSKRFMISLVHNIISISMAMASLSMTRQLMKRVERRIGDNCMGFTEFLADLFVDKGSRRFTNSDIAAGLRPKVLAKLVDEWGMKGFITPWTCLRSSAPHIEAFKNLVHENYSRFDVTETSLDVLLRTLVPVFHMYYVTSATLLSTKRTGLRTHSSDVFTRGFMYSEPTASLVASMRVSDATRSDTFAINMNFVMGDEQARVDTLATTPYFMTETFGLGMSIALGFLRRGMFSSFVHVLSAEPGSLKTLVESHTRGADGVSLHVEHWQSILQLTFGLCTMPGYVPSDRFDMTHMSIGTMIANTEAMNTVSSIIAERKIIDGLNKKHGKRDVPTRLPLHTCFGGGK